MHKTFHISAAVLGLLCAGTVVRAEPVETELKFAAGLRTLGYYDLAAEQFKGLDWAKQPDADLKLQVLDGLVADYLDWAQAVYRPQDALPHLDAASKELAAVLKGTLKDDDRNRLIMQHGDVLLEYGRLSQEVYRRKPEGVDHNAVAAQGAKVFDEAVRVFEEAVKRFADIVKRVEAKPDVDDADRKLRKETLNLQIVAETQVGWARFRRARLFRDQGKQKEYGDELAAAGAIFKKLSETHKSILAGYSATLGHALCLQEMGKHNEAVPAFDEALQAERSKEVAAIRFQAQYEKAASQAELGDYEGALKSLERVRKEFPSLPDDMSEALDLRHARTIGRAADARRAESLKLSQELAEVKKDTPEARKQAAIMEGQLDDVKKEYKNLYASAVNEVRKLAGSESYYAQEASVLLGKWIEAGDIRQQKGAKDFFADGERHLNAGGFAAAIESYREAIRSARPTREDNQLVHDAWVQMGKAYAQLKQYYEAGLVLGRFARLYPESPFASIGAVYSAMMLGAQYEQGKSVLEAQTYLDAQELLVEKFPETEEARRAAFRLGDVRRAKDDFVGASYYYGKVSKASEFFEKAGFLSGKSLWEAYQAQEQKKGATPDANLISQAEAKLKEFLAWAAEQPASTPEITMARRLWTCRTRLLLAEMYHHQKRYPDVLSAITDQALTDFRSLPKGEEKLGADARLLRLRAFCALGDEASLSKAGAEVASLVKDGTVAVKIKSTAARLVGITFLKLTEDMAKKRGVEMRMLLKEPEVSTLVGNARTYLIESIDLDPDQSVGEYTEVAGSLHQAGAFDEAARIFELLVERFANDPAHKDAVRDGHRWAALCYRDAGDLPKASKGFEALIKDFPRWMVVRRDVAACYESDALKRYADAEKQWRVVEENCEMGAKEWFEARFHRIRNLAYQKRSDLAYQMLAATAVPYPNLGGDPWEKQFLALVKDNFTEEQTKQFEALRNEAREEE